MVASHRKFLRTTKSYLWGSPSQAHLRALGSRGRVGRQTRRVAVLRPSRRPEVSDLRENMQAKANPGETTHHSLLILFYLPSDNCR